MLKFKTLKNVNVKNKRVLMRVDFNVPLEKEEKLAKIKETIFTLKYLIKQKSKIILISHLGRPDGEVKKSLSLESIAKELGKLLKKKILFSENKIKDMKFGDILMLENIRFYPEEEKNSSRLAKKLAALGDIFVNEAFAVSHRKHASVFGITKYLPSVAGFLFEREVRELDRVLHKPKHPLIVIIAGAKVETKIKVIEKFLKKADKVLVAGALPNTIFAAKGVEMGKSLVEKDMFKIVEKLDLENPKLQLPVDFICQTCLAGRQDNEISVRTINGVRENESAFDIGPRTIELFLDTIRKARMIVWNGPVGLIEKQPFDKASEVIAKAIVQSKAYSIVGGGDTVAFINKLGLEKKFNYVSTGGGAMLDYLATETLPGIEALKRK